MVPRVDVPEFLRTIICSSSLLSPMKILPDLNEYVVSLFPPNNPRFPAPIDFTILHVTLSVSFFRFLLYKSISELDL